VGSRSDNGGWAPDGDSSDDLPDLPEEWGVIVIPDDLSELSDEVEAIRAELRQTAPRTRWQRFIARPGIRRLRRITAAGVRAPVLIISMAIVVTVASLFASAWPGPPRTPAVQRTANTDEGPTTLPALELLGSDGQQISLRANMPAVVLIIDGCACDKLIADTTAAVRPDIAVVTVTSSSASRSAGLTPATGATPQAQGKTVLALRDPTGGLRSDLRLPAPDGTAAALLVNRAGDIIKTFRRTVSAAELIPQLARL
jgi:hypothetical protein